MHTRLRYYAGRRSDKRQTHERTNDPHDGTQAKHGALAAAGGGVEGDL